MAIKSVNDTVCPEGLVATLLVYCTFLQTGLTAKKPAISTYQRAGAMHKAQRKARKLFAQRQLREA